VFLKVFLCFQSELLCHDAGWNFIFSREEGNTSVVVGRLGGAGFGEADYDCVFLLSVSIVEEHVVE
jgi:hypothetical protein